MTVKEFEKKTDKKIARYISTMALMELEDNRNLEIEEQKEEVYEII